MPRKKYYCRAGRWSRGSDCTSFDWNQCRGCKRYQAGYYQPNFPVPTLYSGVAILPDAVVFVCADGSRYDLDATIVKDDFSVPAGWTFV